jgi:hypothetical protein
MRQRAEAGTVERLSVFEHAEDGMEEFAHDSDEGLHFGLARRTTPTELKQRRSGSRLCALPAALPGHHAPHEFPTKINWPRTSREPPQSIRTSVDGAFVVPLLHRNQAVCSTW